MTKGIANPHFEAGGLQIRRNGGNKEKCQNLYRKGRNIAFSIKFFVTLPPINR